MSKRFEYTNKDITALKKDIIFRTLFATLFLAIFVWQFVSLFIAYTNNNLQLIKIIIAGIVLISTLLLLIVSLLYIFKSLRIVSAIKMNGRCVSSVAIFIRTNKGSFVKLYDLLIKFLTLATSLILVSCITYTFLQITVTSTISYYLPLILMICVSGYNSIYHIKDEIKTQEMVREYNGY